MKIVKILQVACEEAPEGKAMVLYQDDVGFYYHRHLVLNEGFRTPFSSLNEVGVGLGVTITGVLGEKVVDWEIAPKPV